MSFGHNLAFVHEKHDAPVLHPELEAYGEKMHIASMSVNVALLQQLEIE
jgi:hypothetical protein